MQVPHFQKMAGGTQALKGTYYTHIQTITVPALAMVAASCASGHQH